MEEVVEVVVVVRIVLFSVIDISDVTMCLSGPIITVTWSEKQLDHHWRCIDSSAQGDLTGLDRCSYSFFIVIAATLFSRTYPHVATENYLHRTCFLQLSPVSESPYPKDDEWIDWIKPAPQSRGQRVNRSTAQQGNYSWCLPKASSSGVQCVLKHFAQFT